MVAIPSLLLMSRIVSTGYPGSGDSSVVQQEGICSAATSRISPSEQVERAGAYHFLGLHDEAMACLDHLPDHLRNHRDINVLRLSILQGLAHWTEAAALARDNLAARPPAPEFYVMGAFAIRHAESMEAAYTFLRHGAEFGDDSAIWWYNLACYESCLGRVGRAGAALQKAFRLDASYRRMAESDEDLAAWRDSGRLRR